MYLLVVFGDDRVTCHTGAYVIFQVRMAMHRDGVRDSYWLLYKEIDFGYFIIFLYVGFQFSDCNKAFLKYPYFIRG